MFDRALKKCLTAVPHYVLFEKLCLRKPFYKKLKTIERERDVNGNMSLGKPILKITRFKN